MDTQELNKAYALREMAQKDFEAALEIYIQARIDYDRALQAYSSTEPEPS